MRGRRVFAPLSQTSAQALEEVRVRFPFIPDAKIYRTAFELGVLQLQSVPTLMPEETARALGWRK